MGIIIANTNNKGGVAKTTTTINLGEGLARKNKKVLLVDFDPQGNLSSNFNIKKPEKDIYGTICGKYELTPYEINEYLHVVPSVIDLAGLERELNDIPESERILSKILQPAKNYYDFIFIDSPPSLGSILVNVLVASDKILLMIVPQSFSMDGLEKFFTVFQRVKENYNPNLIIEKVLITQVETTKLHKNYIEQIEKEFGSLVFETKIRHNTHLAAAPSFYQSVFEYSPTSNGAKDYGKLTTEFLKIYK